MGDAVNLDASEYLHNGRSQVVCPTNPTGRVVQIPMFSCDLRLKILGQRSLNSNS